MRNNKIINKNITELVGNTPIVYINKIIDDLKEKMKKLNIKIIVLNSQKALKEYEKLKNEAILALHLTC